MKLPNGNTLHLHQWSNDAEGVLRPYPAKGSDDEIRHDKALAHILGNEGSGGSLANYLFGLFSKNDKNKDAKD